MTIYGKLWQFLTIYATFWQFIIIFGNSWQFIAIWQYGNLCQLKDWIYWIHNLLLSWVTFIGCEEYLYISNISRGSPLFSLTNISLSNSDINLSSPLPIVLFSITETVCCSEHMSSRDEDSTTEVVNIPRRRGWIFIHKGDHEGQLSFSGFLTVEDKFCSVA